MAVDCSGLAEPWMCGMRGATQVETRFLKLCSSVEVGAIVDGWTVSWVGGWDRARVFFLVMVIRIATDALDRR